MTKADIVTEISRKTGLEKAAVLTVVEEFMTTVKESMGAGNNVYLRGFGSFVVKTRKEKTARNISKNTAIKIPGHKFPPSSPRRCSWRRSTNRTSQERYGFRRNPENISNTKTKQRCQAEKREKAIRWPLTSARKD